MSPVLTVSWQGAALRVPGNPAPPRRDRAAGACRSLLIGRLRCQSGLLHRSFAAAQRRGMALRREDACRFLLFVGGADLHRRFRAASHKIIVSINGNTITGGSAEDRPRGTSRWIFSDKCAVGRECSAARERKEQCPINRRTIENNTSWNRLAVLSTRTPAMAVASSVCARKADGLSGRPRRLRSGSAIVDACRSLLIHRIRPRREPVRSGGSCAGPDGQPAACRPPSRPTESGGRR
jgi:hypothetical protein